MRIKSMATLAASTVVTALALPVSAAMADPSPPPIIFIQTDVKIPWGTSSGNGLARATKGLLTATFSDNSNVVRITGKLVDLDHRTPGQGGKCAYFRVQGHKAGQVPWIWAFSKTYHKCGTEGFTQIKQIWAGVDRVKLVVCQKKWPVNLNSPVNCGVWRQFILA
jgi:hypothetical protein